MKPAALIYVEGNWLRVVSPFSQEFVDSLKAWIPSYDRRWNPRSSGGDNCWWVVAGQRDRLMSVMSQFYDVSVVHLRDPSTRNAPPAPLRDTKVKFVEVWASGLEVDVKK